jgi:hypothetical protein
LILFIIKKPLFLPMAIKTFFRFIILCIALAYRGVPFADSNTKAVVLDTMKVLGDRDLELKSVSDEEKRTGLTDDINKLIFFKPGINRIPETGSSLLVRGEGPYDNGFRVYSVPVFAPSHFTNNTFCDHSATMIATVKNVSVVTDAISGRYADAPASVISVSPGISRMSPAGLAPRPELSFNLGMLNQDFAVSVPARKGIDAYQLAFTNTNSYSINWLGKAGQSPFRSADSAGLGYAMPDSYGDLVYTGQTLLGKTTVRQYCLFAYDRLLASAHGPAKTIPWGIAAFSAEQTLRNGTLKVDAGGSKQDFFDGKKFCAISPLIHVQRTNENVRAEILSVKAGAYSLNSSLEVEQYAWNGTQDAVWTYFPGVYQDSSLLKSESGSETRVSFHEGVSRSFGNTHCGANALIGGFFPSTTAYLDPGIWAKQEFGKADLGAYAGITTSRPEIRGLPDGQYRDRLIHTYNFSATGHMKPTAWLEADAEAFYKYKDRCPAQSLIPGDFTWDPRLESPLYIRGVTTTLSLVPFKQLTLTTIQDFTSSQRRYPDRTIVYEWDIPWSNKSILRYSTYSDRLQFYLSGIFSAGLPYHDLTVADGKLVFEPVVQRVPTYRRLDFKFQFNQPIENNPILTRYDAYVEIQNVLNALDGWGPGAWHWENTREYYWNNDMQKRPVLLEYITLNLGLRIGFRM